MSKEPKVGDLVRLKPLPIMEVYDAKDYGEHRFDLRRPNFNGDFSVDDIEEVLPRLLAVGDRVTWYSNSKARGVVLAIVESQAWVKWTHYTEPENHVDLISKLIRIDGPHGETK